MEYGEILSIASLKEECTMELNGINRMAHSILTWSVGCRLTRHDHLMNFTASFMVHWVYPFACCLKESVWTRTLVLFQAKGSRVISLSFGYDVAIMLLLNIPLWLRHMCRETELHIVKTICQGLWNGTGDTFMGVLEHGWRWFKQRNIWIDPDIWFEVHSERSQVNWITTMVQEFHKNMQQG